MFSKNIKFTINSEKYHWLSHYICIWMRTGDYLNHISGVMVRILTLRAVIMVNPKTI